MDLTLDTKGFMPETISTKFPALLCVVRYQNNRFEYIITPEGEITNNYCGITTLFRYSSNLSASSATKQI